MASPRPAPAAHGSRSVLALAGLTFAGFAVVVLRLAFVQVARHPSLAEAAVRQRAETVPLSPERGRILDRDGVPLSASQLAYRVAVYPSFLPSEGEGASALAAVLGLPRSALAARLADHDGPVFVANGLGPDRAAAVMALGLEGVAVVADERRYGPGSLARHAVGYAGGSGGDGLEKAWDATLAGRGPERLALFVDGRGQPIPGLGWRKVCWTRSSPWTAFPCDVVTTIDSRVQRAVEEVMDMRVARGAVVVLDPRSGDILAMASRPDFDQGDVASLLDRTDGPLVNRAVWAYPPGSVIKPLVMAAALESGTVSSRERLTCRGTVRAAGREVGCTARSSGGHGELTLAAALSVSCNVVYVEAGEKLGREEAAEWLGRFGLGRPTGVGLPGESAGRLPGSVPAEPEVFFGQGSLTATPLQVACAYATIANGGLRVVPRLVTRVVSPTGAVAEVGYGSPGRGERVVGRVTAAEVCQAMVEAVRSGTGRAAAVARDVAGKTGTAETGRSGPGGEEVYMGWFAGFWPASHPRLVAVVVVEDSAAGGGEAAAIFGEILKQVTSQRLLM